MTSLSNQRLWFKQRSACLGYFAKNLGSGKGRCLIRSAFFFFFFFFFLTMAMTRWLVASEILPKSASFVVPEDGQEHTRCVLGSQVGECPPVLAGASMIKKATAMEFAKSKRPGKENPPFAYAVAIENHECARHAVSLVHSLRKAETKADIVVLVGGRVSQPASAEFGQEEGRGGNSNNNNKSRNELHTTINILYCG